MPGLTRSLILLLLLIAAISCTSKKEEELRAREKELLVREQEFAAKESEYQLLLKLRDSLFAAKAARDSLPLYKVWPDSIKGSWNSKMVCIASNCNNYVIGDQRSETWVFSNDSIGPVVKVINNDKLVRILTASSSTDNITLDFKADSTDTGKAGIRTVLDQISRKVIKGTQTISGQNSCAAKFSVELTPAIKK